MADTQLARPRVRCAVYTRKSSDEGLEQSFNSLDAQREACVAYVLSQMHEGWRLIERHYDDGGFSGGNMDRPALKALLADVKAGLIDVIVVYKIDRLTRSLTDFARIVDVLDDKGVSFVSVTQAFNTTSSMGRLTLNMLLSFAQFEREITSERIRDKIAASKAKGMWMGGVRPFGYAINDRALVPHPVEAQVIAELFERFLDADSVDSLLAEVNTDGTLNRLERSTSAPMSRGALYHLLRNPIYIGEIRHKDRRYAGLHQPIIEKELFERVQFILDGRRRRRVGGERARVPALLTGLLFDEQDRRYTPTHTAREGRRYPYYCVTGRRSEADLPRLPGRDVDEAVRSGLVDTLASAASIGPHVAPLAAGNIHEVLDDARRWSERISEGSALEQRSAVRELLTRVTVSREALRLGVRSDRLSPRVLPHLQIEFDVPFSVRRRGAELKILMGPPGARRRSPDPDLVGYLAKGCDWFDELKSGRSASRQALAEREEVTEGYIRHVMDMGCLAPDLKVTILNGEQPPELTVRLLRSLCPLPLEWSEQRRLIQKACST